MIFWDWRLVSCQLSVVSCQKLTQIAEVLVSFVTTEGITLQQADLVIAALENMAKANVDFLDAFLAETARKEGGTVASFDRDFRRLGVDWIEP